MVYQWSLLRRVRAHRGGSVATEFAMVTPLLTILLFSTVEMGSLLYAHGALQMTAAMSARRMAVNLAAPTTANARAVDFVPGWANGAVTATVTQSSPADPANNNITVRLSAPSNRLAVVSLLTRLVPWTMTSSVTIKQELPYED